MIMGLAASSRLWYRLVPWLSPRHRVILLDNRGTGGSPPVRSRLTMASMARDALTVLDEAGVDSAHVVGASMGGMIAQMLAVRHPDRALSLVSIMSSTGSRWTGQPAFRIYPYFLRKLPADRGEYARRLAKLFEVIGSPGFERDHDELRELAALSYDRGLSAAGTSRQLGAILGSGNRVARLRTLSVPTLVIHGTADRMVAPSGGRHTARAIPNARLLMIEGMGHDLPRGAWPRIVDAIADHAARADAAHRTVAA
jgi:pimeloyl-ACP methyl ester carboxylesterase